jgi:hypothetical protein
VSGPRYASFPLPSSGAVLRFSARSGGWGILAESERFVQEEIYFVEFVSDVVLVTT